MNDNVFERFQSGDRSALARLLSRVGRGVSLHDVAARLPRPAKPSRVVAITGSGGVGKSTLIGKVIEHIRGQGPTVAVLACDPQSPVSGGALLGDRFRMPSRPADDGVFIRSLAAVSGHGAVADHLSLMVRLLEAFGFDVILIETVGAGQGDTAVSALADIVVLLLQPETGDDLQWEKAGLLEVADILVIHKADLPGADQVAAEVKATLELSGAAVPVLQVSSKSGQGLDALWQAIETRPLRRTSGLDSQDLLEQAQRVLARRFAAAQSAADPTLQRLLEQCRLGMLSPEEGGAAVLAFLGAGSPSPSGEPAV